MLSLLLLAVLTGPVHAQNWDIREMDIPLDREDALRITRDTTIELPDKSRKHYSSDGKFSLSVPDIPDIRLGWFEVKPDGRICVEFESGNKRCDLFVRRDGVLWMLTEKGGRFPVRVHFTFRP